MTIKHMGVPLQVKELTERGSFEGLASVYGNVDLGGDVVMPGAFKEFVKTADGSIRILDGHNTRMPIGKGILTDTDAGLHLKGQLTMAVARAREVYELMKEGIIDGLSIGFDFLKDGYSIRETDGARLLKALKLWEVSTTPFPMNQAALVTGVKAIEKVTDIRELEDLLRDAAGLSRSQAKLHAKEIWATKTGQREAGGEDAEAAQRIVDYLKSIPSITKE